MTYFVWTGTNGGASVGLYWGETATAVDLGDCASFGVSAFGSHSVPTDYIAQGFTGGFSTIIQPDTVDDDYYYCYHFHTSDFMLAPPVFSNAMDPTSAFTVRYFPGIV